MAATHTEAVELVKRGVKVIVGRDSFDHRPDVNYLLLVIAVFHCFALYWKKKMNEGKEY